MDQSNQINKELAVKLCNSIELVFNLSSQLKIRYRVGNSAYPNSTYYRGTFKDYRNQWEFFFNFSF